MKDNMKGPSENSDVSRTNLASTKADLRELKTNCNATVQELQEFLHHLRGKSPQEMLGVVATSQLFRATILSVILVTGAIFALTALSYFFAEEEPKPIAVAPADPLPAAPVTAPIVTTPEVANPISPLGVDDKLPAPSNTNPLEDKGEDFLKDLE